MRGWKKLVGVGTGVLAAALPVFASAAEEGRVLERSDDWVRIMIVTLAAVGGVMLLATLGYLYRIKRNIVWDFQAPAPSHDDAGHH
jgi:hypothetical protein